MEQILIDIEEPNEEIRTVQLKDAIKLYELTDSEIGNLEKGKIVWVGKVALSKQEEIDEEN